MGYETHYGKLKKVELSTSVEEWCQEFCRGKRITKLPSHFNKWQELMSTLTEEYVFTKDEVWQILDHIDTRIKGIDVFIPNEDGTITFFQHFHNGETSLEECLIGGVLKTNYAKALHNKDK